VIGLLNTAYHILSQCIGNQGWNIWGLVMFGPFTDHLAQFWPSAAPFETWFEDNDLDMDRSPLGKGFKKSSRPSKAEAIQGALDMPCLVQGSVNVAGCWFHYVSFRYLDSRWFMYSCTVCYLNRIWDDDSKIFQVTDMFQMGWNRQPETMQYITWHEDG